MFTDTVGQVFSQGTSACLWPPKSVASVVNPWWLQSSGLKLWLSLCIYLAVAADCQLELSPFHVVWILHSIRLSNRTSSWVTLKTSDQRESYFFFFFLLCHGSYSSLFLLHSNSYKWVIKADSNSRGGDIDISVGRVSTDVQKCLEHPHSQLRGL